MCDDDDDSDVFASADEGLDILPAEKDIVKPVQKADEKSEIKAYSVSSGNAVCSFVSPKVELSSRTNLDHELESNSDSKPAAVEPSNQPERGDVTVDGTNSGTVKVKNAGVTKDKKKKCKKKTRNEPSQKCRDSHENEAKSTQEATPAFTAPDTGEAGGKKSLKHPPPSSQKPQSQDGTKELRETVANIQSTASACTKAVALTSEAPTEVGSSACVPDSGSAKSPPISVDVPENFNAASVASNTLVDVEHTVTAPGIRGQVDTKLFPHDVTEQADSTRSDTDVVKGKSLNEISPGVLETQSPVLSGDDISREANMTEIDRQVDDKSWNENVWSLTASNLVHGVEGGLNAIADVLTQAINPPSPDQERDREERRTRRVVEEKAEREAISEAWSNVWNNTWGSNGDWEVEEIDEDELKDGGTEPCSRASDSKEDRRTAGAFRDELKKSDSEKGLNTKLPGDSDLKSPDQSSFWGWSGVSSFAQQLTSSGLSLVQEGVNVLEKLGKKTMSVIEENDPGFEYTKKFLRPPGLSDRPNLSKIIREAQEREKQSSTGTQDRKEPDRGNFTSQLEVNRALVHLEALELVSEQAESQLHIRLDTMEGGKLSLHEGPLESIWNALQFDTNKDDEEEGERKFPDADTLTLLKWNEDVELSGVHPSSLSKEDKQLWFVFQSSVHKVRSIYSGDKLLQTFSHVLDAVNELNDSVDSQELFFLAIGALAETTSGHLEYLHKFSECLLVHTQESDADFVHLALLAAITFRASVELQSAVCAKYISLVKSAHKPPADQPDKPKRVLTTSVSQLVANLLLECANAQSYMENAARLLIPVFQLAYVSSILVQSKKR
ncbi:unnamed protein product [Calicophoron daubneyi]|uniref:Protein FAM114A2 n=1 Tax=Calicophoron daubneyi TaxID=300641 RepID=A0AAV2TIP3_CALDB